MFLTTRKIFKGFTLIELLIVIAILGILAAAVLVAVNPAKRTRQAQDAARKNDIGALATAVQAYYTMPGAGLYPAALTVLTASGDIKQLPTDPTSNLVYDYSLNGDTTEAAVWATLADPTSGSGSWLFCWQSTTNKVTEKTAGTCLP